MSPVWPAVSYEQWSDTCDTLHAHTQVLGKLAVALAPPEPQLQHAALRLTARGWETAPLPAPNGSGRLVVLLDLHAHEAVAEHSDGRVERVPLAPDRSVGVVTRELLLALKRLAGDVEIDPTPQEVWWTMPLDVDEEHCTYNRDHVSAYFEARRPGGHGADGVSRALPGPVHAGQRMVGVLRPRGEPVLRPAGGAAVR